MPCFRTREELSGHQLKGLQWTLFHAYKGSFFYKKHLDEAGASPDDIKSLDDINHLPFTAADDLRKGYPLPFLSVPDSDVVRIHASSGTTGKKKILAYTQKDIDDWTCLFARAYEMAGLTEKDRVQIAVGYGMWTAGAGFQLGCEKLGAMAIPIGPGNIDIQCQFLVDMHSSVLCCTASMGLLMAEEVNRRNLRNKIALKKIIAGAERSGEAMRKRIKELLGIEEIFDITGMTELYGPGAGIDCAKHEGIHYWADNYILEIIDPETLKPVRPGEIGEMVVTTLCKEAAPLIRYRTGDLTRLIEKPCSCGNLLPMHDKISGRSDDMIIFRAVNIYPGQIDEALSSVPGTGSEYQVILDRRDDGKEYMTVRVECADSKAEYNKSELEKWIAAEIKNQVMVSCKAEVVDYRSLPRSEKKSKRIFDNRQERAD